jgi:hypothetical protein
LVGCSSDQRGYNPKDFASDWDALSDFAWSTIKLTLSVNLVISYGDIKPASKLFSIIVDIYKKNIQVCCVQLEGNVWLAFHNSNVQIAKWITRIGRFALLRSDLIPPRL